MERGREREESGGEAIEHEEGTSQEERERRWQRKQEAETVEEGPGPGLGNEV